MLEISREALCPPQGNGRSFLPSSFWQERVATRKQECLHPSTDLLGFSVRNNESIWQRAPN